MFVSRLFLSNFRNYEKVIIDFSPGNTFIVGNNGTGKTNILEGLSITSNIRSFRHAADDDMIRWGCEWYYCKSLLSSSEEKIFEVGYEKNSERSRKKIKIDDREIKKSSEYFGKFITVAVTPEDINLVSGPPDLRRRFFDALMVKTEPGYFEILSEYKKSLLSRNRVLKNIKENPGRKNSEHLETWTDIVTKIASVIIKKRKTFSANFREFFSRAYSRISGGEFSPLFEYFNSTGHFEERDIYNKHMSNLRRDVAMGATHSGPQRDDFLIKNEKGIEFNCFASQGQKRTASIAYKTSELIYLESNLKKKAVILVDDIFSELDEKRRLNLLGFLNAGNQVVFTMINGRENIINDMNSGSVITLGDNGEIRTQ